MFEAENDIKKHFRYVSFNSERNPRARAHNLAIEAEQQDNPKADLFRQLRHIVSVAYTTSEQTTTAIYEGRD